jgi:WD40 repeat protein
VHIWKVSTQEQIAHFRHDYYVMSIAFSPDGKYVTAGSGDPGHSLRVWKISTQRETAHMAHVYSVDAVAFSPDGRYVISGDEDLTARVWDARSGKELSRIAMTNVNNVISVAFSPDGRVALAGDYYGNLYMWTWQPEDMIAKACAKTKRNLTRSEWKMYIGDALPYQAVCRNLPIEGIPTPNRIITPTTYSTATH